jgi:phosphoglycolate phosphatase
VSQPALILFDCDGTLVDSQRQIVASMQTAFADNELAAPAAAAVHAVIGLSLTTAVDRLAPGIDPGLREAVLATYRRAYVDSEASLTLYPGVREGLESLHEKGYWLGIVTGKSRNGLLRVLDHFGLHALFQVWRTADCCPSKPHPAMVLECMDELGMAADATRVIGDACFDMEMARAAGVQALGVSYGVEPAERLMAAGAMRVFHRFDEVDPWFPALARKETVV